MAEMRESFIVGEDDLPISNKFIWFMNIELNQHEDLTNIITLSAFNYVNFPKKYIWDCYFTNRTNPWGWATWSKKIKDVDWELANKEMFLSNHKEMKSINAWKSERTRMLKQTIEGKVRAWDIRLDYTHFKRNLITAYSCKNLVINNGFNNADATNTTGFYLFKVNLQEFVTLNLQLPKFLFLGIQVLKEVSFLENLYISES